jgi:hypothetical protein
MTHHPLQPATTKVLPIFRLMTLALFALFVLSGCGDDGQAPHPGGPEQVQLTEDQKRQLSQATRAAWHMAEPAVDQAMGSAFELLTQVSAFLDEPTEANLAQAQTEWQVTWADYQPLHLYNTMADYAPQSFQLMREVFYAIAARPIEPGYLDTVGDYAYSGLVHDISLPLSATTLREQHGRTHEEDVVLGLFALEFMLFGEPSAPRRVADYQPRQHLTQAEREQGYSATEELPENRRRQLLLTQAQLLVEDFHRLQILWQPQPPDSFYGSYINLPAQQRRALLLDAALLELKRSQAQLAFLEGHTREQPETEEASTVKPPRPVPAQVLQVRLNYLAEVLEMLEAEEDALQQVKRAADAIAEEGATVDAAWEALQASIDALSGEPILPDPASSPNSANPDAE